MDAMMMYFTLGLGVLVLILAYACRRQWLAAQDTGMRDWVFSLEEQLKEAGHLLYKQDRLLSQVGELFDHAGVSLEHTEHHQLASVDLMQLGFILRTRGHYPGSPFDLPWAQETLSELGVRYGIEPESGGPYAIRDLVRIAEEILESVFEHNQVTAQLQEG